MCKVAFHMPHIVGSQYDLKCFPGVELKVTTGAYIITNIVLRSICDKCGHESVAMKVKQSVYYTR